MGITVSGVGEATGSPDLVEVNLGVSVLEGTVAAASSAAARSAESVIAALSSCGIARDDTKTTEYSISPEYDYSDNRQRLIGYRVSNMMRVEIRDIAKTGAVLDAVGAAAGDHCKVSSLSFAIEDESALAAAAREAAWNDAVGKATQLAHLAGRTLGRAVSITETIGGPPVPVRMIAADMATSSTPIQPGTSSATVNLQVEFDLGD